VADRYIDNREVIEYGRYFLNEVRKLIGLSAFVDIAVLQQIVQAIVDAMEAALTTSHLQQSGARTGRLSTSDASALLLDGLRRFHYYLKTLPSDTKLDLEAFFPGGTLNGLIRLKPADLLSRADDVLRGFNVPVNAVLPGAAEWTKTLTESRDSLATALTGKQDARAGQKDATGSVAEIRARFLNIYNNVAKRAVHAVLAEIGRLDDYRRYFLDLQMNEDATAPETPDAEPITPAV
jgi:hypothetical protein